VKTSLFDLFKVGIGPSSSHTMGPMRAARRFVLSLEKAGLLDRAVRVQAELYGSLALTGHGHGTDRAVLLGLSGEEPSTIVPETIETKLQQIRSTHQLSLAGRKPIAFREATDLLFHRDRMFPENAQTQHPNGVRFSAFDNTGTTLLSEVFFSIGGGFIVSDAEGATSASIMTTAELPHPFKSAAELLEMAAEKQLALWDLMLENESALRSPDEVRSGILHIWGVMQGCIDRGMRTEGILPGGLNVRRRAPRLAARLRGKGSVDPLAPLDWVTVYAMAVNEENASFGRVVTAPTNGAAGVIPAVLLYYIIFCDGDKKEKIIQFLLTASEIGSIFKKGATISAAMGGCQAEIGVSSAMAAGALTESLGGTQRQVLMAAEIAMEHHLGMTCDPIGGLVQIPCIERNTMGAIKAITASQLALQSTPDFAKVSLDGVIKTMWDTALDMNSKYKETSDGGLAIHIPISLSEC